MDPNETLRMMRGIAAEIVETQSNLDNPGYDLAALFQELDAWLMRGGFLPQAWKDEADARQEARDA